MQAPTHEADSLQYVMDLDLLLNPFVRRTAFVLRLPERPPTPMKRGFPGLRAMSATPVCEDTGNNSAADAPPLPS